jgi:large subunit ribosomal protein L29
MKATELNKLKESTPEELANELTTLTDQLFHLRIQFATGQLETAKKIPQVRRNIARIKTILNEKKRAQKL